MPLHARISALLRDGATYTTEMIAEELGAAYRSVQTALRRGKGTLWEGVGTTKGRGKEAEWTRLPESDS